VQLGQVSVLQSLNRFIAEKMFSFLVVVVDKCVPDRFLLFTVNSLDYRLRDKLVPLVLKMIQVLVPSKLRSWLITLADNYIPDSVANSRKACALLAAVYKYMPDGLIPPESAEKWENLKLKFHVPRLVSNKRW